MREWKRSEGEGEGRGGKGRGIRSKGEEEKEEERGGGTEDREVGGKRGNKGGDRPGMNLPPLALRSRRTGDEKVGRTVALLVGRNKKQ